MVAVILPQLLVVYSKVQTGESRSLREFLERLGISPAEGHWLEDYPDNDSPGAVGLYFEGPFFPYDLIFDEKFDFKGTLERARDSRQSQLAQAVS